MSLSVPSVPSFIPSVEAVVSRVRDEINNLRIVAVVRREVAKAESAARGLATEADDGVSTIAQRAEKLAAEIEKAVETVLSGNA